MVRSAAKNWQRRGGGHRRLAVRRRARRAAPRRRGRPRRRASRSPTPPSPASPQLRRRDQRLPVGALRRRRAAAGRGAAAPFPAQLHAALRQAAGPALRREPAPERGVLPRRRRRRPARSTARAAAGQGAVVQQHRRRRRGLGVRQELGDVPACVIVKHANPCGVALGADAAEAYAQGASRPTRPRPSAASSPSTARSTARRRERVAKQFVEVLIAPAYTRRGARGASPPRPNVRVLEIAFAGAGADGRGNALDFKRVGSGLLLQTADDRELVARRAAGRHEASSPTPAQLDDLLFAWKVAKFVKSNAIVFCARRHDARRRRRPDEPHRLGAHRLDQGRATPACRWPARRWPATPSSRSATASTWSSTPARRCVDPARRLDARRRGHRRRRRARHRDGVHRRAPLPALKAAPAFGRARR